MPGSGWTGFDPTLGKPLGLQHVRVAYGRDYGDVAPVRGVYKGHAGQRLSVDVRVLPALDDDGRDGMAAVLVDGLGRLDARFDEPMPYMLWIHQRPTDGHEHPEWHFHAHLFPLLLRSATVRKFAVGFELLSMPQRDITPETSAESLRAVPDTLLTR